MHTLLKHASAKAMRMSILPATVLATVCFASAEPEMVENIEVPLAGKVIQHGRLLRVSSSTKQAINPSEYYSYNLTGTVRGTGGLLGLLLPEDTPIENFFSKGASSLKGTFKNPTISNTAVLRKRTLSTKGRLPDGTRLSVGAELKIELVDGIAKASMQKVRIKSKAPGSGWANVKGKVKFGSSSKLEIASAPVFQLVDSELSVSESDKSVILKVVRTGPENTLFPVSVDYTTVERTAEEDVDYVPAQGTLNFLPDQTEGTITINLVDNDSIDPDPLDFIVRILDPSRGARLNPAAVQCRVAITNND